jgi:hypothetical protein
MERGSTVGRESLAPHYHHTGAIDSSFRLPHPSVLIPSRGVRGNDARHYAGHGYGQYDSLQNPNVVVARGTVIFDDMMLMDVDGSSADAMSRPRSESPV